jgi:AcrR family transcriptional regulator
MRQNEMRAYTTNVMEELGTKAKIFQAAARLFAEKGYNGVSMREISESTGLSKPTIYYYFGSKEGIYTSLVEVGLHHNLEQFQQIIDMNIPVKQKIIEIVKIRFRQVQEYPEFAKFFLLIFMSIENLPFLKKFIEEAASRRQSLANLIQQGIFQGEFGKSANPKLAADILIGTLMHFIVKQLNVKKKILSDELAEEIVELIFKGLNE